MQDREKNWSEAMLAGRGGDAAAYERLLGEIAATFRRIMAAKLGRLGLCADEAEDIVQEVLIGLHTKRASWHASRPILPWLNAIAHYKLVDAVRRTRREKRFRVDLRPEDWETAFKAPAIDPDRGLADVERHLRALPDSQQKVLRALAVEGKSVRATAQHLRTNEAVVRMTLHRAIARIAASVQDADVAAVRTQP